MPLRFLSVFLHHFYYSYTLILHFLVSIAVFFFHLLCVCVCVCNSTPIFLPTIQTRSMSLWVFTTLCTCIRLHLWYGKWKTKRHVIEFSCIWCACVDCISKYQPNARRTKHDFLGKYKFFTSFSVSLCLKPLSHPRCPHFCFFPFPLFLLPF